MVCVLCLVVVRAWLTSGKLQASTCNRCDAARRSRGCVGRFVVFSLCWGVELKASGLVSAGVDGVCVYNMNHGLVQRG